MKINSIAVPLVSSFLPVPGKPFFSNTPHFKLNSLHKI